MRGWVSIYRSLSDSDLWLAEKFTRGQAWVDMIMLANHDKNSIRVRGIKVIIERGQLARSEQSLANRWRWSKNKTRRYLRELVDDGMIELQKNSAINIISITNYDQYQKNEPQLEPETNPQTEQQKGHQKEEQKDLKRYTNNNVNNDNNNNYTPPDASFEMFWTLYDKKVGKSQSSKLWKNIDTATREKIMGIIPKYKSAYPDKQFRKNPEKYLKLKAWEDEIILSEPGKCISNSNENKDYYDF